MRTLLKITVPVEKGNRAAADGSLPKIIGATIEALRPEASYFFPENGRRTAMFIFDLKDTADIPVIAEPLFNGLDAEITFAPVMNAQDLQAGLQRVAAEASRAK